MTTGAVRDYQGLRLVASEVAVLDLEEQLGRPILQQKMDKDPFPFIKY